MAIGHWSLDSIRASLKEERRTIAAHDEVDEHSTYLVRYPFPAHYHLSSQSSDLWVWEIAPSDL